MNSKKMFYIMSGTLAIMIGLVIFGVFVSDNILQAGARTLMDTKLENRLLEEQQAALTTANKDIIKYAELEKIAKAIVPKDKDQARVVREIVSIAGQSGIPIKNINFPSSTLGDTKSKSVSQLKAVDGIPGVFQMEVTVQSDVAKPVSYNKLTQFLEKLENNRRTAQVISLTVTPDARDRNQVSFSLILNVYIKP